MTLQATLNHLNTLARDAGAELTTSIALAGCAAFLTLYWTPGEGVPREATLVFGESGEEEDAFLWAWVVAPETWLHLKDEGMSDDDADSLSRRMTESVDDTAKYLLGLPYAYVKPRLTQPPNPTRIDP